MVRTYKRKVGNRTYRDYTNSDLTEAVNRCKEGEIVRQISQTYGIPYVTLYRKIKGLHPRKPGGQTVLSLQEEQSIVKCILTAADWGFPMTPSDIKTLVQSYLNQKGTTIKIFVNNKPGETWMEKFLKRNNDQLSKRLSQSIKENRAKIDHDTINKYFEHLSKSLADIPEDAVVNYDETNFTDDPGRTKVVVRRTCKRAEQVMDTSKAATSVMFACSASGTLLPVYIVYKADHLWSTWTENGPPKARYNRSKSGWFDTNLFEDWFFSILVPYFESLSEGPKALIGDNLASHISYNVITKCEEMNIKFILLPPNSTGLTQPLDVCVFRPIKGAWRGVLQQWKKHNKGVVRKEIFPRLLNQALVSIAKNTETNIRAGFEATGIFPLDKQNVLKRLPNERAQQAADNLIFNCMTNLFEKTRFGNKDSTRNRKKKLNVEPGKSVSKDDLLLNEATTSGKPLKKTKDCILEASPSEKSKKKPKQRRYHLESSSDSNSDVPVPYAESDIDVVPEIFSDFEDEDCQNDKENEISTDAIANNLDIEERVNELNPDDYILVSLQTETGKKKEYVAKIKSCEEDNSFLCTFLRKNSKIANGTFTYPLVEDIGIVQRREIIEKLSEFKILRRGHVQFKNFENLAKGINLA